jgi:hypothetical protein
MGKLKYNNKLKIGFSLDKLLPTPLDSYIVYIDMLINTIKNILINNNKK